MRTDLEYDPDRPIRRLETGDTAVIFVTHFQDTIVRDKDRVKYGHISECTYLLRSPIYVGSPTWKAVQMRDG